VSVTTPPRLTDLPAGLSHPFEDTLAGSVRLAGYRAQLSGQSLELSLYWQPLASLPPNLVVFAHVLDSQNRVVAQHDGIPAAGTRPTGTWSPGEYVEDTHTLDLSTAPASPLQVEVGFYDSATGQRLGDRLLLEPVSPG
jgi:hypothetical protein